MKSAFLCAVMTLMLSSQVATAQVFCSSSTGDDRNDGNTERTAVRTIQRAAELGHDIRLRGGDTFFERVALTGTEEEPYRIASYGEGMPRISGFKIVPSGKGLWKRGRFDDQLRWVPDRKGDIFRLDLWDKHVKGLSDTDSRACDIGCLYSPITDEIHGIRCGFRTPADTIPASLRGRQFAQCLTDDYDFYQPWSSVKSGSDEVLSMPDNRYLYVKYTAGNLNKEELWLSCGLTGVNARYLTVDGLHILGWGVHGVGTGTHTNVLNCKIDIIGGSLFQGYSTGTRYGNGIEFYIGSTASDCLCEGNEISRTFDCGITIQGAGFPGATARNIVFRHNTIRDCRQSMEFWLNNAEPDSPDCLLHFVDCVVEDNLCFPTRSLYGREHDGNNSQLLFYQGSKPIAGLTIAGNTFIGGDTYHFNSGQPCASLVGNTFICTPGQYLDRKQLQLSDNPEQEVEQLRRITGERSLHVIVKETLDDPLSREGILWESQPLPVGYDSVMTVRTRQVEELLPQQGDAFLFWTDTHTNVNAHITPYVMRELLQQVPNATDKVVWGGDAIPAFATDVKSYWSLQERMNGVVKTFARNYNVRGNHDFTIRFDPNQPEGRTCSQTQTADWLYASTSDDVMRNPADPTGCYYYFDEADACIRYIVLETNDSSAAPDRAWGVMTTVGDTQRHWVFDQVVPATPQGWGLVFVSHVPVLKDLSPGGDDYRQLRESIEQIGDRRPDLHVLMVLSGHEHYDYASYEQGILHVVTSCNAFYNDFHCSPLHADDAAGEWNTMDEQCFDFVSVARDWTHIHMLRFGPCANRTFALEPLRLKVGESMALPADGVCRWCIHDARGNVCEPLPGYQIRWHWNRTVADVTPAGELCGYAPGESVLIAIHSDGTEEYRAVVVE